MTARRHPPFMLSGFTVVALGFVAVVSELFDFSTRWDPDAVPTTTDSRVTFIVIGLAAMLLGWRSFDRRYPK